MRCAVRVPGCEYRGAGDEVRGAVAGLQAVSSKRFLRESSQSGDDKGVVLFLIIEIYMQPE